MLKIAKAAAVLTALVMLASCGAKPEPANDDNKPLPEFTALNDTVSGRKNVYIIIKNVDSSYWKVILDGAGAGGDEFDCNVFGSGTYNETDWQGQQELIDKAIDAGADGIILAPDDSVKLAGTVEELYTSDMPIVLVDTTANTDKYDICYMTDNLMAGQQAAEELIRQLHESGSTDSDKLKVGMQVGATTSQTINERIAGFSRYWSENAPENWEMIQDIKCNEGDIDKAVQCAEELFDEYSDIKGVFATNNGSTVGFAKVIAERQLKDVAVVGFDYSEEMAALIKSEDFTASTMLQRQFDMSRLGVGSVMSIIGGEKPEVQFIDTGVVVVNRSTLNDPEVVEMLKHS